MVDARNRTRRPAVKPAMLGGMIQPSADGTFALRLKAEVAAIVTVKIGSWLRVIQEH